MSCPICSAEHVRPKLRKRRIQIFECANCGGAFWMPPADFDARSMYDESYFANAGAEHGYDDYGSLAASLSRTFARRLAGLERPAGGGTLLDIGAAFGFAVREARRAGWRASGIEVSLDAAHRAGAQTGGNVAVASASATPFRSASFDVITLWDVIEHLPDPHAAVAEVARLLRPGGRFLLCTGDVGSLMARLSGARWHLYTLPEHLFFHSRRSLRRLLEAHDLQVESMRAESAYYTLGYLLERLRKTVAGRAGGRAENRGWRKLCVAVNLFDVVTVRARKNPEPD